VNAGHVRPADREHLTITVAPSTSVGERIGILDARIAEQRRRVAGIELQGREIAEAVAKMKAKAALAVAADQAKRWEAIAKARQEAADALVALQGGRAATGSPSRVQSSP